MPRRKHEEPHENLERWLVSYADFITLLFAFFTVLYALSMTDKAKYEKAIENIQRAFLSAGGVFPLKGAPFVPFDKPADRGSQVPPAPDEQGHFSKNDRTAMEHVRREIEGLYEQTTGLGLQRSAVEVLRTENGYKIRLGEYVLFRPGSDKLKRESLPFLLEVGRRLVRVKAPIQVEGHTDNLDPRGQSNWQLSINRALNITRFLVEGVKFPKDRISLAGFGDTRPVSENDSAEGRARNRRVEISIITRELTSDTLLR